MEPVSPTSASLLRLESPGGQLHVGWLARLEPHGPRELDVAALRARIETRLERAPRLRAVLERRGDGGGELVWREDPSFDVERHVAAWPHEAGEEEVRVLVDRFHAEPLSHERPLWRALVMPRTRAGGAVVAAKLHRALADGHDAGLLRELVFDPPSGPRPHAPADDDPALAEYRSARRRRELVGDGRPAARIGGTLRRAALAHGEGALVAPPPSFLDGPASGRRTLVTARAELGRLTRIAASTGTTLHDVVLALLAGALRRLALARGEPPADVRALVPLRIEEERCFGDAPCAVVDLPVAERHPASRLAAVHAAVEAAPTLIAGPPEELAVRLAIGSRVSNVTIPIAAGPVHRLRLDGVRVRALFPLTPLPESHALALGTLSYDRHLHVAAAADVAVLPAIRRLPIMLADAVEELGVSTGARRPVLNRARRYPLA
jgi:diacylglycerol O-acyltransferase / wax synthase